MVVGVALPGYCTQVGDETGNSDPTLPKQAIKRLFEYSYALKDYRRALSLANSKARTYTRFAQLYVAPQSAIALVACTFASKSVAWKTSARGLLTSITQVAFNGLLT